MKRLTRWIDNEKDIAIEAKDATKDECMKKLALYEDTGLQPFDVEDLIGECKTLDANNDELREWEEMAAIDRDKAESKLKVYEDAEEEGLIAKLQCKIGDTLYYLSHESTGVWVQHIEVEDVSVGGYFKDSLDNWRSLKNHYSTYEEAEARLKEMETDNERRSH